MPGSAQDDVEVLRRSDPVIQQDERAASAQEQVDRTEGSRVQPLAHLDQQLQPEREPARSGNFRMLPQDIPRKIKPMARIRAMKAMASPNPEVPDTSGFPEEVLLDER